MQPADANGNPVDIIDPRLLIEEITLSPQERMYYQSHELNYKVNRMWSEAGHAVHERQGYHELDCQLSSVYDYVVRTKSKLRK